MKLPFWMMPASWGLKGETYQKTEAEYLYTGEELDRKLVEIEAGQDEQTYALGNLDVDYKYGLINEIAYKRKRLDISYDYETVSVEYQLVKLELDLEEGLITTDQFAKQTATLNQESWVGGEIQHIEDGGVFFKFDWNEFWIAELRQNGYLGIDDDSIMQKWFSVLCYAEMIKGRADDMDPFLYESVRFAIEQIKAA